MKNRLNGERHYLSFAALSFIGLAEYLVADLVFHAYTIQTVLFPIFVNDILVRISGHSAGESNETLLGYFAVFISAILAGLFFALVYWPLERWLVRQRFPKRVLAGRMIAAFLFFLVVWLAFPLKETL